MGPWTFAWICCPQLPHYPYKNGTHNTIGDRKGTTKKQCDKDFAERSGELSGAICLKHLLYWVMTSVPPPNCSENDLVLFVRFLGFVGPFRFLTQVFPAQGGTRRKLARDVTGLQPNFSGRTEFCPYFLEILAKNWAKNWAKFSGHFSASLLCRTSHQNYSPNSCQFIIPCLVMTPVAEISNFHLRKFLGLRRPTCAGD